MLYLFLAKGNYHLFPIAVKRFNINEGSHDKIIHFCEDSTVNHFNSCYKKCGLSITNILQLPVNVEKDVSVFKMSQLV
jgi:hypothetical protein